MSAVFQELRDALKSQQNETHNQVLHQTAIPLRSIASGVFRRYLKSDGE